MSKGIQGTTSKPFWHNHLKILLMTWEKTFVVIFGVNIMRFLSKGCLNIKLGHWKNWTPCFILSNRILYYILFYFIGQYVATVMNKRTIWQKLVNKIYNYDKWKTKFKKSQNETTRFKRSKRCIHNSYQTKEKLEQSGGPLLTNNPLFFKTALNSTQQTTFDFLRFFYECNESF